MRLVEYLAANSLKPIDFARRIGVPSSTVSRLLSGERGASLELALKIEEQTGGQVAPADLVKTDDPERGLPPSSLPTESTGAA